MPSWLSVTLLATENEPNLHGYKSTNLWTLRTLSAAGRLSEQVGAHTRVQSLEQIPLEHVFNRCLRLSEQRVVCMYYKK